MTFDKWYKTIILYLVLQAKDETLKTHGTFINWIRPWKPMAMRWYYIWCHANILSRPNYSVKVRSGPLLLSSTPLFPPSVQHFSAFNFSLLYLCQHFFIITLMVSWWCFSVIWDDKSLQVSRFAVWYNPLLSLLAEIKKGFFLVWVSGRVFAIGPGDLGSIFGWVIPKTQKVVLDTSFLYTQHYKVRFKGKEGQSGERNSALLYT